MKTLFIFVVFTLVGLTHLASAQTLPDEWIIPEDKFECIVTNLEAYKSVENDPVLIFVTECPETDVTKIMRDRQKNSLPKNQEKKPG